MIIGNPDPNVTPPKGALAFVDGSFYKIGVKKRVFRWDGREWVSSSKLRWELVYLIKECEVQVAKDNVAAAELEMDEIEKTVRAAASKVDSLKKKLVWAETYATRAKCEMNIALGRAVEKIAAREAAGRFERRM